MIKAVGHKPAVLNKSKEVNKMFTYVIAFHYSRDGKSWTSTTRSVKASSDEGDIAQIESMYDYVKNIQIRSRR